MIALAALTYGLNKFRKRRKKKRRKNRAATKLKRAWLLHKFVSVRIAACLCIQRHWRLHIALKQAVNLSKKAAATASVDAAIARVHIENLKSYPSEEYLSDCESYSPTYDTLQRARELIRTYDNFKRLPASGGEDVYCTHATRPSILTRI